MLIKLHFSLPVPQQAERATERQAVGAAGGAGRAAGGDAKHRPPRLRTASATAQEEGLEQAASSSPSAAAATEVCTINAYFTVLLVDAFDSRRMASLCWLQNDSDFDQFMSQYIGLRVLTYRHYLSSYTYL